MKTYVLIRDVTPAECNWLPKTLTVGTRVYQCRAPTYGAVREFSATFSPEGHGPFFELPYDAIQEEVVKTDV